MNARDALIAALKANNPPEWAPYADAVIADLAAAGFKILPREPTEEMKKKGDDDAGSWTADPIRDREACAEVWRAMWEAA